MRTKSDNGLKPHWFQILLTLADGDRHGLAIMEDVLERTEGSMHLWPGMLYGALHQMTEQGLIAERSAPKNAARAGGKPRFYRITPRGRKAVAAEARRLARYVDAARDKKLLEGSSP